MKYFCRIATLTGGFFFFSILVGFSQNQTLADSLEEVYLLGTYREGEALDLLRDLAANQTDTDKKIRFSNKLIETAKALGSTEYLFKGFLECGNAFRLKGDLTQALEAYFQGAKIVNQEGLKKDLGKVYIAIADVYSIMGNHSNATTYYTYAINMLREEKDSVNLATALLNAGDEHYNYQQLDSALFLFQESGKIFRAINYEIGVAYNLGNMGLVHAKLEQIAIAEANISMAIELLEELGDYYPISVYLISMSDIYLEKGDREAALNYALRSLELSKRHGLKDQISEANLKISELFEKSGNFEESFNYYRQHILYRDSVNNIRSVEQMADLRTDFEVSQKQIEVDLLNQQKRNQRIIVFATIIASILIGLLALGLYRRNRYVAETNRIIERERNRSDNLLLNILPEETAEELKENGKVQAKRFESVTVLFTDFKGFTQYSEKLSPEELVESVDFYFSKFDEIMEKYDLEKIKTVGDAYMCAGGLPFPTQDHASKMVDAAFEIIEFVNSAKMHSDGPQTRFDIRLGMNTGPVVAGVVGSKKFAYDIWGDTVNVASRMEAMSVAGRINVSESTYELIKDDFICDYRGEIEARNRGKLKMYFVTGRKSPATANV
jgi:class 3 adenylate cyclase